jgi:hypothetical protein
MLVSMTEPSEALASYLVITTGDAGDVLEAGRARPGDITDASDATLAELRRRAVDPVVAGLLRPGEVEELTVHWGEAGPPGDVWVRLVARGEVFVDMLSSPAWEGERRAGAEVLAARLADHLEDWICETRFGWGQRRVARYTCPE